MGGLFAANLLRDRGWSVEVFERAAEDLAGRGAGIGTHEELLAVLQSLDIGLDADSGMPVAERVCLDHGGNVVCRIPWGRVMSAWARIYRPLKDRLPGHCVHAGRNFTRFSADGDEVVAHFEDGAQVRADVLIGADGVRSTVRGQLFPERAFPEASPRYAGYVGWRGVVEASAIPPGIREELGASYYFALPPGEMMVCYPVPGRDGRAAVAALAVPGRGDGSSAASCDWNYVWYRATASEEELRDLCTDAAGRYHGTAIPPPQVRRDLVEQIRAVARAQLAPKLADIVELSQPFFQAIFDVGTPCMASGRVALLGDAAFVARPHIGMGVTKAALDAWHLARELEHAGDDVDGALGRYDRSRGEFGRRCVARARALGAYIEARARPGACWTTEALDQSPERILREIGAKIADIPALGDASALGRRPPGPG